jgi:hypothetical protein
MFASGVVGCKVLPAVLGRRRKSGNEGGAGRGCGLEEGVPEDASDIGTFLPEPPGAGAYSTPATTLASPVPATSASTTV